MARPKKATVDYFSHDVNHGKTLTVLEDRFGNDGYAFWFKLLEALGRTDGHCLDCSDPAEWAFLASRAHVTKERAEDIMQSLEELGAIDRELWKHDRKVWCQNLVERLDDVYKRRQTKTPCKPVSAYINPTDPLFPPTETDKVNKRKGKERKEMPAQQAAQFVVFWDRYGYKVAKADAEKAWINLNPSPELFDTIISAIDAQLAERSRQMSKGVSVPNRPYPATWLNARRWEDELRDAAKAEPVITSYFQMYKER